MLNYSLIFYVNGIILILLSLVLFSMGAIGAMPDGSGGMPFMISAVTALFLGVALFLSSYDTDHSRIGIPTGYLLTVSCWISVSFISTMPLFLSDLGLSFTDAFFETASAITTTGSTVISGLDSLPFDLLLWRSLLQWFGGIGIVVMAMAILPFLRVGGMNLFQSESSYNSEKVTPRITQLIRVVAFVYILLTITCAIFMHWAGMSMFDAVNHAMTTLATGGYSTHDASLGHFDSVSIEVVTIFFMICGALPLIMYANIMFLTKDKFSLKKHSQIKLFFILWAGIILAVAMWNLSHNEMAFLSALRVSAFNVTSILTDTGYATADFAQWGGFAVGIFFFLFFIGGCAGSTSGAIKMFRWQLLIKGLRAQFLKMLSPNRVQAVIYAGEKVDDDVLHGVRDFIFIYLLTFVFFSLVLMAYGLDFLTSTTGVAQAMANAGPGLGEIIGPAGNFSSLPDMVKWILCLTMFLGRLELYTIYVLLMPSFWKP